MKNWQKFLASRTIVNEVYYIDVPTQYDQFSFKITYTRHNGYTTIDSINMSKDLTVFGSQFVEWLHFRQDFNTRFDKPHWYKPIRFNRRKKLVIWAVKSIDAAYREFSREIIDKTINE